MFESLLLSIFTVCFKTMMLLLELTQTTNSGLSKELFLLFIISDLMTFENLGCISREDTFSWHNYRVNIKSSIWHNNEWAPPRLKNVGDFYFSTVFELGSGQTSWYSFLLFTPPILSIVANKYCTNA